MKWAEAVEDLWANCKSEYVILWEGKEGEDEEKRSGNKRIEGEEARN